MLAFAHNVRQAKLVALRKGMQESNYTVIVLTRAA